MRSRCRGRTERRRLPATQVSRLEPSVKRMSLYVGLQKRAAEGRPLRVGLIGAGKFGAMYLAQVPKTPGVHLTAIADLSPANAIANLQRVGWAPERFGAASLDDALGHGTTHIGDDWQALLHHPA